MSTLNEYSVLNNNLEEMSASYEMTVRSFMDEAGS